MFTILWHCGNVPKGERPSKQGDELVGIKPNGSVKARRKLRIKHALWAGLIALACLTLALFRPVDQVSWVVLSRMAPAEASGDIVFIGSEADLTTGETAARRAELTQLLDRLGRSGVAEVYLDARFQDATSPDIDAALNRELRDFPGKAYLVSSVRTGLNGQERLRGSIPEIENGVKLVGSDLYKDFTGFAWDAPYRVGEGNDALPNIAVQMADREPGSSELFPINYYISLDTIPSMTISEALSSGSNLKWLRGKTVVIGNLHDPDGVGFNVPGHIEISPSVIHIYAAEGLKAGNVDVVTALMTLGVCFALLIAACLITFDRARRIVYAGIVISLPVALVVGAQFELRMQAADAFALLAMFGFLRFRTSMAHSIRLKDADTGLPTFAALENDRDISDMLPAIIVARIHRFEEVRRSLPKELHGEYMLRITARLNAATQDATIYLGQGHMIAWTMAEKDPALLREHLEGLRALFSSPLLVGNEQVDVGITFGVDISPSPNVTRRLASAVAVAEQTNETFEPIAIADTASQEDLIWNISLQARIDAALSNREIYLAYQPKVLVQTGEIVGVEALVRWKDPEKGHIPPDNFIRQCETAGRMSQLTRYVLEEACRAGNAFADSGIKMPVAVNISATLVHERAIVQMVSDVLHRTGFDAHLLTLEITETYRISNIDRSAEILNELRQLGCKMSMDDFGVGAASLEALMRLPFTELKIDRIFVSRMIGDPKAAGIVRNVLAMGRDTQITVVAEGVEDAATLTLLRDSGCIVAQGFGISRPVDFDKIVAIQRSSQSELLRNMV